MLIRWLGSSERDAVERIWTDLESELDPGALANSWDWTGTWLRHYGDVVSHDFAVADADGAPCGIALVTRGVGRRRGPFRVRTVHLGTAGEPAGEGVFVEYNRLLVRDSWRDAFATALVKELHRDANWHEFTLDGFAPEEAEAMLRAEPQLSPRTELCPVTELDRVEPEAGVIGLLSSGTRRKVRRSFEALGEVTTEWSETPEHALDMLAELIELHQARWTGSGEPGAFASPRFVAFHRDLIAKLLPRNAAFLFRVRSGDRTVGCLYHLVDRGRPLFYQSGLASFEDRRIAPGFVAFSLCMQACYERGFHEYDFLAGDSRYKRDLATGERRLVWATATRPALRWRAMDLMAALRTRLRHG